VSSLSNVISTVLPERIGSKKEILTAKEALATQHRMVIEASVAYIAASEKAGSKAAASACRTRTDDLSTVKSKLEAALDRKTRDLEDRANYVGALTQASLRSLRLGTPPRSAVESASDEDEDDPEAALARVELELRCSQLELRRNRLIAKVKSVKSRSESGRSSGGSISS